MGHRYKLVIEGDAGGYSAYVPELPTILVTAKTVRELRARAAAAIAVYWRARETEHVAEGLADATQGRTHGPNASAAEAIVALNE